MRLYPGGWDDDREHAFRMWLGELRRAKPELPEQPDQEGRGLELRRNYLEIQLKMLPEEPKT